jgi:hypothetical protein
MASNIVWIVAESIRYDVFSSSKVPNLLSMGDLYEAHTHGSWTRPSVTSMLSGYLPQSDYGQIFTPSWVMISKQMLKERDIPRYFINGNAWVANMAPSRYIEYSFLEKHQGEKMVSKALKIMELFDHYFIFLFLTESHIPYDLPYETPAWLKEYEELVKRYNAGEENEAPELTRRRSGLALEYIDDLVSPLLDKGCKYIFTSDHGELMGEHHKIGHDPSYPFHESLLKVPLIVSEGVEV